MPFENLTGDASLDWMARALSAVISAQSAGGKSWQAFDTLTVRDAQSARATLIVQGYLTRRDGIVRARATVRDEAARSNVKTVEASGPPDNVLQLAASLARQLAPSVREYTTGSAAAVQALFSGKADAALAADPQWGLARLENLQQQAASGDRDKLLAAVEAARNSRLTEAERARLDVIATQAAPDVQARLAALVRLAEATPADPQLWKAIAELSLQAKRYKTSAEAFKRVLEFSPEDQAALNSRGYALMFAGDSAGALESMEEYRRVAPDAGNPLDSLGEVHFYFRRYAEAARYFTDAHAKDPRTLGGFEPFRAALSTFVAGDIGKADEDIKRFLDARKAAGDELSELRRTLWLRLTGRKATFPANNVAAKATAALWLLADGDRTGARTLAEDARRSAALPPMVAFASQALLLTEPSADAAVWQQRIPSPAARPLLGFALLLDGKFQEAAKLWREIADATPGPGGNTEQMALAWALAGAGNTAEARKIVSAGYLPPRALDPGLELLVHAKAIELRPGK